jgi:2-(1,2-epoxy-1,2-dihydrophenyl)acetyl-CoA isomerase
VTVIAPLVRVEPDAEDPAVVVITLDRPERRNALSHALLTELLSAVQACEENPAVRAVVLTGAGDRAFSSGADLRGGPSNAEQVLREHYNPLITALVRGSTPYVAAVNGMAAGAGVSLALACDLRVATAGASFRLAFVGVGLVPDAGCTWLLPRIVGATRAAEMALLGTPVSAAQALDWGLVNEVVPEDTVVDRARELARAIAAQSASTGAIRTLLHEGAARDLATQLDAEATAQGYAQHHPDFAEAKLAFIEKRPPQFRREPATPR